MNLRKWEVACGLAAALVGCLALAFALFGPVYRFQSCSGYGSTSGTRIACQTGTETMLQVGIPPSALIILGIFVLALLGVAISAMVQSHTGGRGWRIVLWAATLFLVIITFLTGFSIGLFLLPSTLLALLASAFSLGARRATRGE